MLLSLLPLVVKHFKMIYLFVQLNVVETITSIHIYDDKAKDVTNLTFPTNPKCLKKIQCSAGINEVQINTMQTVCCCVTVGWFWLFVTGQKSKWSRPRCTFVLDVLYRVDLEQRRSCNRKQNEGFVLVSPTLDFPVRSSHRGCFHYNFTPQWAVLWLLLLVLAEKQFYFIVNRLTVENESPTHELSKVTSQCECRLWPNVTQYDVYI